MSASVIQNSSARPYRAGRGQSGLDDDGLGFGEEFAAVLAALAADAGVAKPGLLRQYFPKGGEQRGYTQPQLDAVARSLNERPRETLGFHTPAEAYAAAVAMTA